VKTDSERQRNGSGLLRTSSHFPSWILPAALRRCKNTALRNQVDREGLEGETSCAGVCWTTEWPGPNTSAPAILVRQAALLEGSLQPSVFPHVPPLTRSYSPSQYGVWSEFQPHTFSSENSPLKSRCATD